MSKTFAFNRFDIDKYDSNGRIPAADGDYVLAEDAINRDAVQSAKIRTLEMQLKDALAASRADREAAARYLFLRDDDYWRQSDRYWEAISAGGEQLDRVVDEGIKFREECEVGA
ncbi:TPA: hypothetical protein QDB28_004046 [Burkholderia vietnamiensis]|nr:hypothetical protein [Burkholderia vietnamiensis]